MRCCVVCGGESKRSWHVSDKERKAFTLTKVANEWWHRDKCLALMDHKPPVAARLLLYRVEVRYGTTARPALYK
jgi:hypothetical protein